MPEVISFDRGRARVVVDPQMFEGAVAFQGFPRHDADLDVGAVYFDDGARTRPHVHSTDQLLVVIEGRCVVADDEGEVEIGVGQAAVVTRGKRHWHGAVPGSAACHLSVRIPGPTDWDPAPAPADDQRQGH